MATRVFLVELLLARELIIARNQEQLEYTHGCTYYILNVLVNLLDVHRNAKDMFMSLLRVCLVKLSLL